MDNERGFTLIELLIVLAIMGILVGITALSLGDIIDTTETTTMNAETQQVQTAIDVYNTQNALGADCCGDDIDPYSDPDPYPADPPTVANPAVQVDTTAGTFGQFLRRTTKYYYTWDAGGEDLEVFESAGG